MAITRRYETKEECVRLFLSEEFDFFPSWTVMDVDGWYDRWQFEGLRDAEDLEFDGVEDGLYEFGLTHPPMWTVWFIPNSWIVRNFINENREKVAEMGFTLIYCEDSFFAIGVDGAGYNFADAHFAKLYDAMGMKWHE